MNLAITILTGCFIIGAGAALGLWQMLSAPDRPNYPTSGVMKRLFMFWFMVGLIYRGCEVIVLATRPEPVFVMPAQVFTSGMLFLLFTTFLVDHVRNWLPAKTHARIRQLLALAACRPHKGLAEARASAMAGSGSEPVSASVVGPALATLSMQGMTVFGPNEGPESLLDDGAIK